jgi:hypothetical protein
VRRREMEMRSMRSVVRGMVMVMVMVRVGGGFELGGLRLWYV